MHTPERREPFGGRFLSASLGYILKPETERSDFLAIQLRVGSMQRSYVPPGSDEMLDEVQTDEAGAAGHESRVGRHCL